MMTTGHWLNRADRSLPLIFAAVLQEIRGRPGPERQYCAETGAGYLCMRPNQHNGRHIATGLDRVLAAFPGDHPPTLEDLGPTP